MRGVKCEVAIDSIRCREGHENHQPVLMIFREGAAVGALAGSAASEESPEALGGSAVSKAVVEALAGLAVSVVLEEALGGTVASEVPPEAAAGSAE